MRKFIFLVLVVGLLGGCAKKIPKYDASDGNPHDVMYSKIPPNGFSVNSTKQTYWDEHCSSEVVYVTFSKPLPDGVFDKVRLQMKDNGFRYISKRDNLLIFKYYDCPSGKGPLDPQNNKTFKNVMGTVFTVITNTIMLSN